ncbi:MAG: metal ABC transporter ATP-binding protein [Chloroflexota bacterium]
MTALEVRDLTVRYGTTVALAHVSLRLDPGEQVALVGPNGAGKSTLLRAMSGLVAHDGAVQLGSTVRRLPPVALIPQRSSLDHGFPASVEEIVMMGRRRHLGPIRRPGSHDHGIVRNAMEITRLTSFRNRPIATLSGGELQRALIARALAQEASILLIDEALNEVDLRSRDEILSLFHRLGALGTTLFVATHDLSLVRRFFPRCIALNRRVVADGPPSASLDAWTIERTFGSGDPDGPGVSRA